MAGIVVARTSSSNEAFDGIDGRVDEKEIREDDLPDLDQNNDGTFSQKEARAFLSNVEINVDILTERLMLEERMRDIVLKMPAFCLTTVCFLAMLTVLSQPGNSAKIHKQIMTHFKVNPSDLREITTFDHVYNFIETFEQRNSELQATSSKYWCEERYFRHFWSDKYMVPVKRCPSSRFKALGLTLAKEDEEEFQAELAQGTTSDAGSSTAKHRRRRTRRLEGHQACQDNEEFLKTVEVDDNATCEAYAERVCEIELGIIACPLTCGMCPPFEYKHLKEFDKPLVTMVSTVVHQTRFETTKCHGFAETYENQPYNSFLVTSPALDGIRHGRVLTCIDRDSRQTSEYAHSIECPPNRVPEFIQCVDGYMQVTKKHEFKGEAIYPRFIARPKQDLGAMRAMHWLDMQTDTVTVSTLVYTEGVEIFTSVSIGFRVDLAGNIVPSLDMLSYTDLIGGVKTEFVLLLVVTLCGSLIILAFSVWGLYKEHERDIVPRVYELLSRGALCVFCLTLFISWTQQVPMSKEYDLILHSFLDFNEQSTLDEALGKYFDVKTFIAGETKWLRDQKTAAYILCYTQFVQLLFYFGVHPRMGALTSTLIKAVSNLVHFLGVFLCVYCMLAFMAFWMLGDYIHEFRTYADALKSQIRILFGEYIHAENAGDLDSRMECMYWIYAITFMFVVFFTLLNFFLAIVVDGFMAVKQDEEDNVTEMSFMSDYIDSILSFWVYRWRGWPAHSECVATLSAMPNRVSQQVVQHDLKHQLEEQDKELHEDKSKRETWRRYRTRCLPEDFMRRFPCFKSEVCLAGWLHYYYKKCKFILTSKEDDDDKPNGVREHADDVDWKSVLKAAATLTPLREMRETDSIGWGVEAHILATRILQAMKHQKEARRHCHLSVASMSITPDLSSGVASPVNSREHVPLATPVTRSLSPRQADIVITGHTNV